ncbi:MAG: hypothetical protein QM753_01675 [Thermomicrobiales bacterium]
MGSTAPTSGYRERPSGQVPCSYHPNVMTGLRCSRCGKPICPECAVHTPVGWRCPDCAGVRGLPTYRTSSSTLLKAIGLGLLVAVGVAVLWRFFPAWQFYLCLLLGFGVVETMAKAANYKRGLDLQLSAMGVIAVGLVLARVLIAQRWGIDLAMVNDMVPGVARVLQLELIPDLVYAAIPFAIAWIRFR